MALNPVELGYEYFPDPTKGSPVYFGSIYVGEPDLDPQIPANQKTIQYRQEDGTLVPATQPVATSAGGVPLYNGSPVQIIVDGTYSIKVLNSSGSQVYYRADSSDNDAPLRAIVTPFDTLTELRANTDGTLEQASLAGHTTKGDGGGGDFWFDTSDTSTADDNGINIVDAQSPRTGTWKRIYSGAINVKWFRAVGDDTANDTAALKAVIAYIKAASGGGLFLPKGTYQINDELLVDFSSISIYGEDRGSCIIKNTAVTPAMRLDGADYITDISLKDFTILGDSDPSAHTGTTGHGLVLNKISNGSHFENLDVRQNDRGLSSTDSFTCNFINCRFQHNRSEGAYTATASNNFTFTGCQSNFNGLSGIRLGGSSNSLVDCNAEGNEQDQIILTGRNAALMGGYLERPARSPYAMIRIDGCVGWSIGGSVYVNDEGGEAGPGDIYGVYITGSSSNGSIEFGNNFRNTTGDVIAVYIDSGLDNVFHLIGTDSVTNNSAASNRVITYDGLAEMDGGVGSVADGDTISHALGQIPDVIQITSLGSSPRFVSVKARTTTNFTVGLWDSAGSAVVSAESVTWSAMRLTN
jgi:hypothetical protein